MNKIAKSLLTLELISLGCIAGKLFFGLPAIAAIITLSALGIFYFLIALSRTNATESTAKEIFVFKLLHIGGSILSIGSIFTLQHWPDSQTYLIAAMAIIATVILFSFQMVRSNSRLITRSFAMRSFVFFFVALSMIGYAQM